VQVNGKWRSKLGDNYWLVEHETLDQLAGDGVGQWGRPKYLFVRAVPKK